MESPTAPRYRSRAWDWLDDRLGIGGLRYPVPAHANSLAFTLGGITLVSFLLLVITGIYLSLDLATSSYKVIPDSKVPGALLIGGVGRGQGVTVAAGGTIALLALLGVVALARAVIVEEKDVRRR